MTENTTSRPAEDLILLLMKGDEYREIVLIDYLGQKFEVPIRPLNELELAEVMRNMKSPALVKKMMAKKREIGDREMTEEEKAQLAGELMDEDNVMDAAYNSKVLMTELCKKGITDEKLSKLVMNSKWGLRDQIGKQIQKISTVPPEVIKGFFEAREAKST